MPGFEQVCIKDEAVLRRDPGGEGGLAEVCRTLVSDEVHPLQRHQCFLGDCYEAVPTAEAAFGMFTLVVGGELIHKCH